MQAYRNKLANIFFLCSPTQTTLIDPVFCEAYQYFTICNILKIIYLFLKLTTSLYFLTTTESQHIYLWTAFILAISLLQIIYFSKLVSKLIQKSNRFQQSRSHTVEMEDILVVNNGSIQYLQQQSVTQQSNLKWMVIQIQNCVDSTDGSLCKLKMFQMILDKLVQVYGLLLLILLESVDKWDSVYLICILYIGTYQYMEDYIVFSFKAAQYIYRFIKQTSSVIQKKWKIYRLHLALNSITYNQNVKGFPQCGICLSKYTNSDQVLILKCSPLHHFHSKCIQQWMAISITCPICRAQIVKY